MRVVVTPAEGSPAVSTLDVVAAVADPVACVDTWRETGADAVLVDADADVLTTIREADGGDEVPLVLVTDRDHTTAPADALLSPAAIDDADAAVDRARTARDYRKAVTALFEACHGRDIGRPEPEILELRRAADSAYDELEEIPPSVFYAGVDHEGWP